MIGRLLASLYLYYAFDAWVQRHYVDESISNVLRSSAVQLIVDKIIRNRMRHAKVKFSKIRTRLAENYYELKNAALDRGLFGAQNSYNRFVVIGRARVGSTLLRTALANHHQVAMYGEIFRIPGQVVWNPKFGKKSERIQKAIAADPPEFLRSRVYRSYSSKVKAVGFKIFYYHAENGKWENVWPYLEMDKDIIVIHNKRRNILKSHLSNKRAYETGKWADKSKVDSVASKQKKMTPIHLDYEELNLWFNLTKKWEEHVDTTFAEHKKMDVYYEDLAENYSSEITRVQNFLGLEVEEIEPTTKKQAKGPLHKQISNFSELKSKFVGTPWIEFFEE